MPSRRSTKLAIPHPNELSCRIVGILEQLEPEALTRGRKIALILHGTLGHKDYLFQKTLAAQLPLDSFRFDFRGNHETGGVWKQGALSEDLEDLQAVVDYLKVEYEYVVDLVVGHSRGSVIGFRWVATSEDGKNTAAFVNVSGRYRMEKIVESEAGQRWVEGFAKQGYYEWNVTVARQPILARITPNDLKEFIAWDTSFVWNDFPQHTDVLTVHGLQDHTVPPYDAVIYTKALSNRHPGTATLHFIENGDHNFTGRKEEVVEAILQWLDQRQKGKVKALSLSLFDVKAQL
ncbi:ectomycorrhiza-regulated esterase [Coprinopsis sp. MPI-PUGE-AT-0042]|nr:ectomycorrhiza-regulated esterase [Coprinopsis sp. MPI-PUGE-AT-0042]